MKTNTKPVKDTLLILLLAVISFYLVLGNPKVLLTSLPNSDSGEVSLSKATQDDLQKVHFDQKIAQTHAFYKQIIAAHEDKINTLNGQIKRLRQFKEVATQGPDSNDKIANTNPSLPMIEVEEMQAVNQQHLASELEQHLADEPYDSEWAESIEDQMANVITEELQLEGNELVEATCRSTLCRIEIGHESQLAESKFLLAIASHDDLINSIEDVVTYRVAAEDSGDGIAHSVFFIARKGHQLPTANKT